MSYTRALLALWELNYHGAATEEKSFIIQQQILLYDLNENASLRLILKRPVPILISVVRKPPLKHANVCNRYARSWLLF